MHRILTVEIAAPVILIPDFGLEADDRERRWRADVYADRRVRVTSTVCEPFEGILSDASRILDDTERSPDQRAACEALSDAITSAVKLLGGLMREWRGQRVRLGDWLRVRDEHGLHEGVVTRLGTGEDGPDLRLISHPAGRQEVRDAVFGDIIWGGFTPRTGPSLVDQARFESGSLDAASSKLDTAAARSTT
jgi:hypothetical protein